MARSFGIDLLLLICGACIGSAATMTLNMLCGNILDIIKLVWEIRTKRRGGSSDAEQG